MKESREERARQLYDDRGQWASIVLPRTWKHVWGIPSRSDPSHYYLCDGDGCTCPDFRFRGLSGVRIGHAGAHHPCAHILAVRLVEQAKALAAEAVAETRS